MRFFLFSLLFFISSINYSQNNFEKPNYKSIKRSINKTKSSLFYPKLLKKYTSLNSQMTLKEKRHLYYGFVYNKKYKPFGFSIYNDSLHKYAYKKINKVYLLKMFNFSEKLLAENPFNIDVLTFYANLQRKNKDKIGFELTKKKLQLIFDVINSSGNGLTKKTAYHVIFRNHKKGLLKHKNLKFNGVNKTTDKYRIEYLKLEKNKANIRGGFFNVSAFKINLKSKR